MNINSRTSKISFTGYVSGAIASFTGLREAPTKVKVTASGVTECNVIRCGANVWDEEWELGIYDINTGEKSPATTRFRSVNKIPILPNTNYYCKASHTTLGLFYNKDGTFITGVDGSANYMTITNRVFLTPANAYYMVFFIAETTYNHDISFNYPSTDTNYHAYTSETYTIPVDQTVTQITQLIGVNNIFVVDKNVDSGNVEAYYVTI